MSGRWTYADTVLNHGNQADGSMRVTVQERETGQVEGFAMISLQGLINARGVLKIAGLICEAAALAVSLVRSSSSTRPSEREHCWHPLYCVSTETRRFVGCSVRA